MTVRHIGQRSIGASLKMPGTFLSAGAALGFAVDLANDRIVFGFRRERRDGVWGWRVELTIGRLTLPRNWTDGIPFPRRRRDAERWACEFAQRHGFEALKLVDRGPGRRPVVLRIIRGGKQ